MSILFVKFTRFCRGVSRLHLMVIQSMGKVQTLPEITGHGSILGMASTLLISIGQCRILTLTRVQRRATTVVRCKFCSILYLPGYALDLHSTKRICEQEGEILCFEGAFCIYVRSTLVGSGTIINNRHNGQGDGCEVDLPPAFRGTDALIRRGGARKLLRTSYYALLLLNCTDNKSSDAASLKSFSHLRRS